MFTTGTLRQRSSVTSPNSDSGAVPELDLDEPEDESDESEYDDDDDDDDADNYEDDPDRLTRLRRRRIMTSQVTSGEVSFLLATGLEKAEEGVGLWKDHMTFNSIITSSTMLNEDIIGLGLESGQVALSKYVDSSLKKMGQVSLHETTIRDISTCGTNRSLFATGSYDNTMCLWDLSQFELGFDGSYRPTPIAALALAEDEAVTSIDWRSGSLISCAVDLMPQILADAPSVRAGTPSSEFASSNDSTANWMSTATTVADSAVTSNLALQSFEEGQSSPEDFEKVSTDRAQVNTQYKAATSTAAVAAASPSVWEDGSRYALYDARMKLAGPALAKTTGRRGLLCVKHLGDWEVLLGFESGLVIALDLRKTDGSSGINVVKDPYVSSVATIETNPSRTRLVTAGVTDTTIWSTGAVGYRDGTLSPVYHIGESTDRIETEEFLVTNASFINDDSCVLTNHHGTATLVLF